MNNRKFIFLMRDFIASIKGARIIFNDNQALVGMYNNIECRIEGGYKVGMPESLILFFKLDAAKLNVDKVMNLNGNFNLLRSCYIAYVQDLGFCLVRVCLIPEHVNQLNNYISETLGVMNNLIKEIGPNEVN